MDGRRSSRRVQRLLVRIHSAENLRHVSSQGTYCKVSIDPEPALSSRSSLKRLLQPSSTDSDGSHQDVLVSMPRIYKTQAQKALRCNPVWKEKFELPVYDAMTEVLHVSLKSARLITAPSIGTCSIPLRDVPTDTTADQWINLLDNSKRPAGRLRIQMLLVHPSSSAGSRRGHSERGNSTRLTMPLESPVIHPPSKTTATSSSSRSNSSSSLIHTTPTSTSSSRGSYRRSTPLSNSLMDARGSSSTTTTSDSIVSDCSNGRLSVPASTTSSFGPESSTVFKHSTRSSSYRTTDGNGPLRETALSSASRGTVGNDELDFLASKYMNRSNSRRSTVPEQPAPVVEQPPLKEASKDDRSPRTTNTTTGSSDDDDPASDMTVEFVFDTGEVRPSTRLPSQLLRTTSTRSSVASSTRYLDSESDMDEQEEEDSESEPEDDELDPDSDPDGPRMVLRNTVTKLLGRQSVNVIMDEGEEDEDDDDEFEAVFVYDELPILDFSQWLKLDEIDCTDRRAAAS